MRFRARCAERVRRTDRLGGAEGMSLGDRCGSDLEWLEGSGSRPSLPTLEITLTGIKQPFAASKSRWTNGTTLVNSLLPAPSEMATNSLGSQ